MKPLSERDENGVTLLFDSSPWLPLVGMKPLSERDENSLRPALKLSNVPLCRNEATL